MSNWSDHDVLDKVLAALNDVHILNPEGHHLGRPYMTAYQLAIKVNQLYPQLASDLGLELGGQGTGSHTSLVQYLARQLSGEIRRGADDYPVEGAFLSNEGVDSLTYDGPNGPIRSSLTGTGFDLSMFRSRQPVD